MDRPFETANAVSALNSAGSARHASDPRDEANEPPIGRLIDRAIQPFAMTDLEGLITRVNHAFADLTGYSTAELIGMSVLELSDSPWRKPTFDALARVFATGKSTRYERVYRRKDGGTITVEVALDLERDDHDAPVGYYAFITDVSERRQVEAALRESEERFRRLYDEAPVGYHEVDLEGRIISINRTECEMLGYSSAELIGRSVFDFIAEDVRPRARAAFAEKIDGETPLVPIERTLVTRDGCRIDVSIEERFNRDGDGRIVGLRSTVQNITVRKRTEAALIASERRARALFEGIEDAVFVHSPDGRILDANPAASRLLGYGHTELLALSTREIDDPEFAAGFQDRLAEQLTRGHLNCEGRHRTKYGRVIPVEITTSLVQFDGERAVLAVIRDITERKSLEETRQQFAEAQQRNAREIETKNRALTVSEARYRQLTEGCLDAVVVADHEGRITLFNPAAERTFGYRAEEVLGQPLGVLVPDDMRAAHDQGFQRYVHTRDPRIVGKTIALRGVRKNCEEFPLELSLNAVESGGELQFIGSIRDQTERERMQAILLQTDKLASIGLLSAGVAHEINNPLAYVANNLAVLERELKFVLELVALYESSHPALTTAAPAIMARIQECRDELDWDYVRDNLGRMLARTREGVLRITNIVQSLRGLARTAPPQMESASIAVLYESALEMIRGRLRRHNIEIVSELGDLPHLVCSASQIGQVILNLLVNASQAIEASGRTEGGRIRFAGRLEGAMAVLEVSDNGCGIPDTALDKLFDAFYTTKPEGEGTGLGLSISQQIVTAHGGRFEVESHPGAGSCFRIVLPVKPSGPVDRRSA